MTRASTIFSICGLCERVAAQMFLEKGRATKIERKDFPPSAPTKPLTFAAPDGETRCRLCLSKPNECRCEAEFAIVLGEKDVAEFNELVADLRA